MKQSVLNNIKNLELTFNLDDELSKLNLDLIDIENYKEIVNFYIGITCC